MKYFKESEFECKCGCGRSVISRTLVKKLDEAREKYGSPMIISSGYRCITHNRNVGGVPGSYHTQGKAVDIECTASDDRFLMLIALLSVGFRRIGIAQGFIHVDVGEFPLNSLWVYK